MCCFRAYCGSEFLNSCESHFVWASWHHPVPLLQPHQWDKMGFFIPFKKHLAKQLPMRVRLNFLPHPLLLSHSIRFLNTEGEGFFLKPNNINFQPVLIWNVKYDCFNKTKLVCFYFAALKDHTAKMSRPPSPSRTVWFYLTLKKEELGSGISNKVEGPWMPGSSCWVNYPRIILILGSYVNCPRTILEESYVSA